MTSLSLIFNIYTDPQNVLNVGCIYLAVSNAPQFYTVIVGNQLVLCTSYLLQNVNYLSAKPLL